MKHNNNVQMEDYLLALKESGASVLMKEAEEAMHGMLVLNGTGPNPVSVGTPPRWDENPCGIGGYTWTISRLKYMVTLSKAFLNTGNRAYLDKVENDLENWLDAEPAPEVPHDMDSAVAYHGVHHWRMLELGYRMVYTFPPLFTVLSTHGENPELINRMKQSIAEHAERIAAGSHLLWPEYNHNHYTQEINGLLSAASIISEHPSSSAWIDQAIDGLEKACAIQLTEDGAQMEGAAAYHSDVVIDFCYAIHCAGKCGRTFSPAFIFRVKNGIAYAVQTMAPNGTLLPFGDSDAFVSAPILAAILGYLLFEDDRYLVTLRQFVDAEKILQTLADSYPWGFDNIAKLVAWLKRPLLSKQQELLPLTSYQRQMDQYVMRTGWDRSARCLFFSCHSPLHYGNHGHMDQLGIIYGAYGKILLQDPGRFTYKDCEDRHLFKSSEVHNLPTVDGRDAFEYVSTFVYGPQKEGSITSTMDTERIKGVSGTHKNYEPVVLSRSVAMIDGKILLIADTYEQVKNQNMAVYFHLNSTNVSVNGAEAATDDQDVNVRILSPDEHAMQAALLDGRLSDLFYHDYQSTRVVFSRKATQDVETLYFAVIPSTTENADTFQDFHTNGNKINFTLSGEAYLVSFEKESFQIING